MCGSKCGSNVYLLRPSCENHCMTNQENSSISKELWQAYLETDFKVFSENLFTLKVGQYSDELNSIIKKSKYSSAAFITAYNPYSKQLSNAENIAKQEQLKIEIAKRGLTAIEGIGQHPSNQWLSDVSVCETNRGT